MYTRNFASATPTVLCQTDIEKVKSEERELELKSGCLFLLFIIAVLLLPACKKPPQMEIALGTVCAVNLYEGGNNALYSRIFFRVREIDRTMNFHTDEFQELLNVKITDDPEDRMSAAIQSTLETLTSGVIAVNRQAGIAPVKVRADLIELLEKALYYAELSDGAFDPTVGPLVRLWDIGPESGRVPGEDEIADALALVNWRHLEIDREAGTVFLPYEGMAIDLGAIAKGYAADEAARIAREAGVKRAVFDFGGNIVALGWRGKKGKEQLPWRIGIQNPLKENERGVYIGILQVDNTSVVTSGVYERFFESGGKRYHHILSTTDGYPVDNGLLSVTIVTASSADADALSTTVFALGFERGKALIDSIPDTEAVFIFDDNTVRLTAGLTEIFTLRNDEFILSL
jgi:thiamine biosynthesis lipoprotein